MPTLPARLGALALAVVLLAGCKVEGELRIGVRDDGSGVVVATAQLDADAVTRIERFGGGPVAERIRLDDLRTAGWRVSPWRERPGGGARVSVRHGFRTPEEAERLVAQLAGATGLYRDARVRVERETFREALAVALTADLTGLEVDVTHDRVLAARLEALGVDPAAVELLLSAEALEAVSLVATVELAGRRDTARVAVGETATVALEVEATRGDRVVRAVVAAGLTVLGLVLVAGVLLSAGRARRRSRQARRSLDEIESGGQVGEAPEVDDPGRR